MTTMISELYAALLDAGVATEKAQRAAEAVAHANDVATKGDLRELEARLAGQITSEIERAKADIIKWVAGLLIAQAAVVATLVKLL